MKEFMTLKCGCLYKNVEKETEWLLNSSEYVRYYCKPPTFDLIQSCLVSFSLCELCNVKLRTNIYACQ